jgi:hypothetical protein
MFKDCSSINVDKCELVAAFVVGVQFYSGQIFSLENKRKGALKNLPSLENG